MQREMSDSNHVICIRSLQSLIDGTATHQTMRCYVDAVFNTRLESLFRSLWFAVYNHDDVEFHRLLHIAKTTSYRWQYADFDRIHI